MIETNPFHYTNGDEEINFSKHIRDQLDDLDVGESMSLDIGKKSVVITRAIIKTYSSKFNKKFKTKSVNSVLWVLRLKLSEA